MTLERRISLRDRERLELLAPHVSEAARALRQLDRARRVRQQPKTRRHCLRAAERLAARALGDPGEAGR
jgi:hypothetical protein